MMETILQRKKLDHNFSDENIKKKKRHPTSTYDKANTNSLNS